MKDGIKRMMNGLEDEKLGVFGSWRESDRKGQQGRGAHSVSLLSTE